METNKTKFGFFKIFIIIVLLSGVVASFGFYFAKSGKVVAKVNDTEIEEKMLDDRTKKAIDLLKQSGNTNELTVEQELRSRILDELIIEILVSDYSAENNVLVSDVSVEQEYSNIAVSAGGEEALETQIKTLGATKNDLLADIKKSLILKSSIENYAGNEKLAVTEAEAVEAYNTLVEQSKQTAPEEEIPSFEETKEWIFAQVKNQKLSIEAEKFVAFLKSQATIEIY